MNDIKIDLRQQDMTLIRFLKHTSRRYNVMCPEEACLKPEKELTEKQLFDNLKKELKKASVKLN